MFSALAVIIAFVTGAAFGVCCLALAIYLAKPIEAEPEAMVPMEPVPKHRPITELNVKSVLDRIDRNSHPAHRPISGG